MYGRKFYSTLCVLFLLAATVSAQVQNTKSAEKQKISYSEAVKLLKLGIGINPIELRPEAPTASDDLVLRISGTATGCEPTNLITRIYGNYIRVETEILDDSVCTQELKEWSHIVSLGVFALGEYQVGLSIRSSNENIEISRGNINITGGNIPQAKIESTPEFPKPGETVTLKFSGTAKPACLPSNPQLRIEGNNITFLSDSSEVADTCAESDETEVPWEYSFPVNGLWDGYYKIKAMYFSGAFEGIMGEEYLIISIDGPVEEPTEEPTEEPAPAPTEEPTSEPTEEPAPEPEPEPTVAPAPEPEPEPAEQLRKYNIKK